MKALESLINRLFSKERRKAGRHSSPKLLAHYWSGSSPAAHEIRDISATGLYVKDPQRWYPGTQIMMSLQRTDCEEGDPARSVSVNTVVVYRGTDGMGVHFLPAPEAKSPRDRVLSAGIANKSALHGFLQAVGATQAQALVEYILLLPLVLLLIVNVVNFGGFFFAWITVANAARAGADYAILGGASVGSLRTPTAAQITSIITQDASSLPNQSSLSVNICQSNSGGVVALSGTCTSIPSDPEQTNYTLTSVDVTYTYQPFISAGFKFPNMNVYATIPPTSIHRRAVMRTIE